MKRLNEQEQHGFQQLVEEVRDYICVVVNHEGHILAWNQTAEQITGYSQAEATELKLYTLIESAGFNGLKSADSLWSVLKLKNGESQTVSFTVEPVNISYTNTPAYLIIMKRTEQSAVHPKSENSFSAYMALHEFQEPMRRILLYADTLQKDPWDKNNTLKAAGKIKKDADHVLQWIKDMLNYARTSDAGSTFKNVDLAEVVAHVKINLEEFLKEKNALVEVTTALPTVTGDEVQLFQMFSNLVENAVKYNHSKPHITITAETLTGKEIGGKTGNWYAISVHDNGIGFEPEMTEQIFRLFVRGNTNQHNGYGIGLALCMKVAKAHGGTIKAESAPGKGSVFTVYLPAK